MEPKEPKPKFVITLEALPSDVPVFNRLRSALKSLLRMFGFRCLECREVVAEEAAKT